MGIRRCKQVYASPDPALCFENLQDFSTQQADLLEALDILDYTEE